MKQINKSRKGIVYGLMTGKEQWCLKGNKNIIEYIDNEWVEKPNPAFFNNGVYWSADWDEPTKGELKNKYCFVWDSIEYGVMIDKVINYHKNNDLPYESNNSYWKNSIEVTHKNLDKIIKQLEKSNKE